MSLPTDTTASVVMYALPDLAALIIKDQGLHEGHFELSVEFNIAVGAVGPSEQAVMPGAIVGIKRVGLRKVDVPNVLSVDASKVNPAPAKRKRAVKG